MRSHLGLSFFQRRANSGMLRSIALTVALATGLVLLLSAPASIMAAPAPPILSAPSDGAQVNSPVVLSWGAPAGAVAYDVYISVQTDPEFINLVDSATDLRVPSYQTIALAPGTYIWYVEAFDSVLDSMPSSVSSFVVVLGPVSTPIVTPTPIETPTPNSKLFLPEIAR